MESLGSRAALRRLDKVFRPRKATTTRRGLPPPGSSASRPPILAPCATVHALQSLGQKGFPPADLRFVPAAPETAGSKKGALGPYVFRPSGPLTRVGGRLRLKLRTRIENGDSMRLTLRTLLAYLDGNLEPDDSQDIGKKIEESEFATKLVHLIRDCTRRLRLGAPPVLGRGLATDPNSVAEYLEYRLADDRVPEFERICLESEIHLAEVAACHQILTLVLGEPVEINAEMRQRLYHVADPHETAVATEVSAPPQAPPVVRGATPPPVVRRPKPEVPDYLRESRWRWWPVAALVLLAATLTFAGLFIFGPSELRERVIGMGPAPEEDAAPPADDQPSAPAAAAEQDDQLQATDEAAEPQTMPPADADEPAVPSPAVIAPEKPSGEDADAPPAPEPKPGPLDARPSEPTPPEPSPDDTPPPPEPPTPDDSPAEMPDKPAPEKPAATPLPEAADAAAPREPAEGFGRSNRTVLLKLDPATGNWSRLRPMSPLEKGDRLLSLPLFRPTITLSSNITVQADGAASFELEGWTPEGVPILAIHYGRLLMLTVGKAGNPLVLKVDGQETLVTFVDASSSLAVEVRRDLPPGQDPEAAPSPLVANVIATDGPIRLRRDNDPPIEFQAPAAQRLVNTAVEPPAQGEFPGWVTRDERSARDEDAAEDVDGYLTPEKLAGLQLRELNDSQHKLGRKREVRSLAIRCLAHLGEFEPSLAALNDEDLHSYWPTIVAELQSALARGPSTAAAVRVMLEKQRGSEDGAALYRMLWGYTAADLAAGADRSLVAALGRNDALDFRVLGIWNLEKLTGATHGYHPEDSEIRRQGPTNTWKHRIDKIAPRGGRAPAKGRAPATKGS